MPHIDFLEMVLAEAWDDTAAVNCDRATWAELTTLRFVDENYNALILESVGVGKTFLATALGLIACRRRYRVPFERADKMFMRLPRTTTANSATRGACLTRCRSAPARSQSGSNRSPA
jgi:DNA replication protein DnaC